MSQTSLLDSPALVSVVAGRSSRQELGICPGGVEDARLHALDAVV